MNFLTALSISGLNAQEAAPCSLSQPAPSDEGALLVTDNISAGPSPLGPYDMGL